MNKIFQGLTVIELASVLAGPAVGMFFAELGAKVIKIENPTTGGDVTRTWYTPGETKNNPAAYFYAINYNKEHIFLNLKLKEDREKLNLLLKNADILVNNFPLSKARKFEVDYERIKADYPRIIYAQLDGFIDFERPAYDVVLQAETGFLSMTGLNEDHLAKMPVALIDILAAHQLKQGILCALLERQKTKKGCLVKTSLEASAISSLTNQATNYLIAGHIAKPIGTAHPNIAPYGDIFTWNNGEKFVLAVGNEKQFKSLASILSFNNKELDSYDSNQKRVEKREQLIQLIEKKLKETNKSTFYRALLDNGVPFGKVNNIKQVFDSPQSKNLILRSKDNKERVSTVAFKLER